MPNQNTQEPTRAQSLTPEARSKGGQNSPGNFKKDPERAAEAGRKGGEHSHGKPSGEEDEE